LSEGEGKDEALLIEALDIFQKEGKRKAGGATDCSKMSARSPFADIDLQLAGREHNVYQSDLNVWEFFRFPYK
jgi:hypothetical protein